MSTSQPDGCVARFNVTPVASTQLHHPESILLSEEGVTDDRVFLFVDTDGKRLREAEKAPVLGMHASYDPPTGHLGLRFADGSVCDGGTADVGPLFSVSFIEWEIQARIVAGPFAAAVSAQAGRELRLARAEPPDCAGGTHRVSLVSLASVRDVAERGGIGDLDARRFRMLVEVEGCPPYREDEWTGRCIQIGGAVVRVGRSIPRCLLTELDPDTGAQDVPTLRVLAGHRRRPDGLMLGVYGDVVAAGVVRVGDPVVVVDEEPHQPAVTSVTEGA